MTIWYTYMIGALSALGLVILGNDAKLGFVAYMAMLALTLTVHGAFKVGASWAREQEQAKKEQPHE